MCCLAATHTAHLYPPRIEEVPPYSYPSQDNEKESIQRMSDYLNEIWKQN